MDKSKQWPAIFKNNNNNNDSFEGYANDRIKLLDNKLEHEK